MTALLSWDEAFAAGVALVGGKGWNLARLDRYGLPVPAGAVLPVSAWSRFATHNGFDAATVTAEQVTSGHMPPDLRADIAADLDRLALASVPLAVRSSAVAEDGAAASFAGIHDSVLNVFASDITAAILRCWASAFSERARAYRQRMGLREAAVAPAVVVQRLVNARAAGVAFTIDPASGRSDRVLVAANAGLGETVVAGIAEPDQYLVECGFHAPLRSVVARQPGRKQCRAEASDGGGTRVVEHVAAGLCLDDATVLNVVAVALRARWALGHDEVDQDVEWVWDGDRVALVQARPVTVHKRWTYDWLKAQPEIWSNGNLRDALPLVMSPMTWSLTANPLHQLLPVQHRAAGSTVLPGMARMKLVDGRGYLDASLMQWEYWDTFGIPPVLFNQFLGGHQAAITVPPASPGRKLRRLWANLCLGRRLSRARKGAEREFSRWREHVDAMLGEDLAALSDADLVARMAQFCGGGEERDDVGMLLMSSGATLFMLRPLLERFLPGRGAAIAHALLAEQAAITSAEHGRALAELAAVAVEERADVAAWRALPPQSRFRRQFEDFLNRWGHRSVYELELAHPRWREDPEWLLETIRSLMTAPPSVRGRGEALSRQAWREIEAAVPRPLHGLIRRMAAQSGREAAHREEAKSLFVRAYEPMRRVVLEIGDRLVARGALESRDDVFRLTWEEAELLLTGGWSHDGARALIRDRAVRAEALARQPAADVITVEATRRHHEVAKATDGPILTGAGVASGVARGKARVILRPEDGHRLGPGEILVAPSTDPAWTPLFLRAAAVVMETGGLLSHGAIVAREYGLPAVVNVRGVLQRLRDGMDLIVDGDRGVVTIEAE